MHARSSSSSLPKKRKYRDEADNDGGVPHPKRMRMTTTNPELLSAEEAKRDEVVVDPCLRTETSTPLHPPSSTSPGRTGVDYSPVTPIDVCFRHEFSQNEEFFTVQTESAVANSRIFEIRLLLDSKVVGAVIGKKGANISKLRGETSSKILIARAVSHCLYRVCSVEGRYDRVTKAIQLISDSVATNESVKIPKPMTHTLKLLIDEKNVGWLIGKNGITITRIRNATLANIYISSHSMPQSTEKTVDICGTRESVHTAVALLILRLAEKSVLHPTHKPYYPNNDTVTPSKLDGARTKMSSSSSTSVTSIPNFLPTNGGPGHLMSAPTIFSGLPTGRSASAISPLYSHSPYQTAPGIAGSATAAGLVQTVTSVIIPVPKERLGSLLGPKGSKIKQIRNTSRAKIHVDSRENERNKDERIVTVKGSPENVGLAVKLIGQAITGAFIKS